MPLLWLGPSLLVNGHDWLSTGAILGSFQVEGLVLTKPTEKSYQEHLGPFRVSSLKKKETSA